MQDEYNTDYTVNVNAYSHLTTYEFGPKPLLRPDIEAIRRNLPELVALPRWVLWQAEWIDKRQKYTKRPINPHTLDLAESDNPETWGTFEQAAAAYRKNQKKYAGIGFMLPPLKKDPLKKKPGEAPETDEERQEREKTNAERERINALADAMLVERINGWDFDHSIVDGQVEAPFAEYVERLDSYAEISPSGNGLRVFVRAELPPAGRKIGDIETYTAGRFLTVTGLSLHTPLRPLADRQDVVTALHTEVFAARNAKKAKPKAKRKPAATKPAQQRATPAVTLDDSRLLEIAFRAKNGANVQALYGGDFSAYASESEADLALCHHLAFYSGGDADQVDRLFRNSGLYRDKWDELRGAETYGARTIVTAIDGCDGQFYTGGKPKQADETPTLDDAEQVIGELAGMELQAIFEPRVIATLATAKAQAPGLYAVAKAELKKRGITRDVERAVQTHRRGLRLVTDADDAGETTAGQIFADAPVSGLVIPTNYQLTPEALIYSTVDEESNQVRKITVCNAPVLLTGRTVDIDSGDQGVRLSWKRGADEWEHRVVDRDCVANAQKFVSLAKFGLPVTSNNAKDLVRYCDNFEAVNYSKLPASKTTSHFGWQGRNGAAGFLIGHTLIQPDGTAIDATMDDRQIASAPIAFRTDIENAKVISSGYHSAGTLDAWRDAVNKLAGIPFPTIALFSSFAAPLLEILGCASFIVSLDGTTSQGKTTCQRIAASVWGDPDEARPGSTVRSWDSTAVGFERTAGILQSLPVIIDDTKRARKPGDIGHAIYAFAQGSGRVRGSVRGVANVMTWRTVMISSGEQPIVSFTEDGGTRMRVLALWGAPFKTGAALVDELNLAVGFNYGHAGPAFIQALLRRRDEWPEWRARYEDFARDYTSRANTEKASRLAKYAAAVRLAGDLAVEILDLAFEKNADPFETCWKEIAGQADDAAGAERALELVYSWAAAHETHFVGRHLYDRDGAEKIPSGGWAGKWPKDPAGWDFLAFFEPVLNDILTNAGFSPAAILGEWKERGWLDLKDSRMAFKRRHRVIGNTRAYMVSLHRQAFIPFLPKESGDKVGTK